MVVIIDVAWTGVLKWIIDYALKRCVGFTQPCKASRVKSILVLEITPNCAYCHVLMLQQGVISIYSMCGLRLCFTQPCKANRVKLLQR